MENSSSTPYKFKGVVHFVGETQTFASGFAKRLLVCKQAGSGKYPNYAAFEFTRGKGDNAKDHTTELDNLDFGDEVEVSFYIDARENPNKPGQWFSSNRAVKIENTAAAAPSGKSAMADDDEDMPF